MALSFKSLGRAIGSVAKPLLKTAAIAGATAVNPALGAVALKMTGTVKKALSLTRGTVKPPPAVVPVLPVSVPLTRDLPSYGMDSPVLLPAQGAIPMGQAPTPSVVPAMPYDQFRSIMVQAYQKGQANAFGA